MGAVSAKMQDATPKEPNDSASKTSTNKKTNSKKEDEIEDADFEVVD